MGSIPSSGSANSVLSGSSAPAMLIKQLYVKFFSKELTAEKKSDRVGITIVDRPQIRI